MNGNTVQIFLGEGEDLRLYITYGLDREMDMKLDKDEAEVVDALLDDPNFWVMFLGSISAALGREMPRE